MINIVRGDARNKPVSSKKLADYFESSQDKFDGTLYIGYPIIGTADGGYQIDALLVCRNKGLVAFHLIEGTDVGNYQDAQDDCYTKIQSKLIQHRELTLRRSLAVDINIVTFATAVGDVVPCDDYPLFNNVENLNYFLSGLVFENVDFYEKLVEVLQSITTIRKGRQRKISREGSRGFKLKKLEESIANLDRTQNAAVIETVEGVQRIRGLAGSGKTIILALKVAYLHAKNPDWKIAVTFNTRSLKEQFKKLIRTFSFEHINEEPNWDNIDILHAWGSSSMDGVYYNLCRANSIEYLDYGKAKSKAAYGEEFTFVCEKALSELKEIEQKYNLIVIDEAQDFSKEFLQICYGLLYEPKQLVYAYDELQSLNEKSMLSPEEIFGHDETGSPLVKLVNEPGKPKQDIVLFKCYRNPKETLTSAHALGFGIYRKPMVQMFAQTNLWHDIGYKTESGQIQTGKETVLFRDDETSPDFLSNHSPIEDLIKFECFEEADDQASYIVEQIRKNIQEDELRPDDIVVINADPLRTKSVFGSYRKALFELGINSDLAGVSTSADVFFTDDVVTFTGVHRAKGNEAAMVYIVNADYFYSGRSLAKKRNMLFTAMTRSKAWLRVCGIGEDMQRLTQEYEAVKAAGYKLDFIYPTEDMMSEMNVVNRDMSIEEHKQVEKDKSSLSELVSNLMAGNTRKEDLPAELVDQLKKLL